MRQALKSKTRQRSQIVVTKSYPAPIGGWNSRDAMANMKPHFATKLLNWFPTPVDCLLRGGFSAHGTHTGHSKTLAVHTALTGSQKMFSATDADIFNVSAAGAGVDQSLTVTNGEYQWVNMGNGTANYLIMVNGSDSPKYYDGTNWVEVTGATSPLLSGVTLANLVNVCVYQGRLFFLENSSLSFWYLAAGAVGGALTEFQLDSFAPRGGYLMWAAAWTFDGGSGPDDYIVFMTSEGEALVYRGTNPSSAATWVRVGTFFVGKPLGRKSYINFAGDLLALTQEGLFPMSAAMQNAQTDERVAITDIINYEFNYVANSYQDNYGWSLTLVPLKSALIVNIPVSETTGQRQFVMNTITKAWCEFDSWDALCFVVFNDELYFGGNGVVRKAWDGTSDLGDDIVAEGRTAFNYFDSKSQQKKMNLFRPILRVNGSLNFLTGFDVDFNQTPITGTASYTSTSSATWDTSLWDSAVWTTGLEVVSKWTSPNDNIGFCVAGKLKVNTNSKTIRWQSCDYVYETGGIL